MPSSRRNYLSPREREALNLARELTEDMREWMSRRGVTGATLLVSGFVNRSGEPCVLIQANGFLARAMILSFAEQYTQASPDIPPPSHPRRDNGSYHYPTP